MTWLKWTWNCIQQPPPGAMRKKRLLVRKVAYGAAWGWATTSRHPEGKQEEDCALKGTYNWQIMTQAHSARKRPGLSSKMWSTRSPHRLPAAQYKYPLLLPFSKSGRVRVSLNPSSTADELKRQLFAPKAFIYSKQWGLPPAHRQSSKAADHRSSNPVLTVRGQDNCGLTR